MSSKPQSKAEQLAKKAEDYPAIFGSVNLTHIRENVGEILKHIGRDGIFREYTLHDANHIDAMLALVDKLIPADTAAKMKTADWLMIVLSCYFHDLGMVVTKKEFENRDNCPEFLALKSELLSGDKGKDYEEALEKLTNLERDEFLYQEFVRKNHAKRIFHWIRGQDAPQYGEAKAVVEAINTLLCGLEQVVRDDLAKVCLSHHEDDLFDFDKYQVNRVYGDDPAGEANLHYAALILRSADILQIQKKRVPPVLYKLIDPSNPKSQEEWVKQAGVRAVKPKTATGGGESDTIEVHAAFDKESAYFGLLAYLQQFASKELERCYDWSKQAEKKGATFRFPWKQIDSSQVEPRGFEGRSYKFTLDQDKILKLLTGHTLYNDSRVAVREVLQNALDAVRFRKHLNSSESIGKIEVIWDSKTRKLIIRDTGTGMTQETIEKFLLNVGSSFYQSETVLQKYSSFSPISRFGIGVLSTFMIADEVQILTVHPEDEFARRLTLPSVVKSYLIKKLSKSDAAVQAIGAHGTEVTLQVRRSANLKDVEALVRHWLVIPRCEVTCKTDAAAPVSIGFPDVKTALEHYHKQQPKQTYWRIDTEVRQEQQPGVELAYIVQKSSYSDVWDFEKQAERREKDPDDFMSWPPGMCVEGIRVRSASAGYDRRNSGPWVLANLTGRDAPRTNVARSDIEQTPELERALLKIYSSLGSHVQNEFNQLLNRKTGIVEAAREADYLISYGLAAGQLSNPVKFEEAMAELKIIALEDKNLCRAVSKKELETFPAIWTLDSRLVDNIEGISGTLGINISASEFVKALGKEMIPLVPQPRILGRSTRPLRSREVSLFKIYPEERSHRIDVSWETETQDRWATLPRSLMERMPTQVRGGYYLAQANFVKVARKPEMFKECTDYDMVIWRGSYFIFASCVIELLDLFGMTDEFARCLGMLIEKGSVPKEQRPLIKEQLVAAKSAPADDLLNRLALPFDRRFGEYARGGRGIRWLSNDW